ncbi:tetratricopeptide repeat protein 29 [Biomphalaria glabrata]|uniref:Tetratricopeptide repeat protein 29 n=1 Tax=Biomphalaria glabrata TaxID=6526 RepID=A0A9U8E1B9_BIOGL|nr:tetratricopeptide repeat protein 29-like [Biomphalaria glabrata]XP_013068950.2 tetratricopeptide repeat protein 29-like [Biomphalaria glabrata]XP_055893088.1 tetratricopeptide repeat protein 29-like [Biomphalaria glabrata]KAI8756800.1 tetratricopeptide repeat protein 29-like [Biomphalaria glabrata]
MDAATVIQSTKSGTTSHSYMKRKVPPSGHLEPIKGLGRRDKQAADKSALLRSALPVLRKQDIAKFRNSYKHNLCLDMLTEGFHLSFCELINLIRQQHERREAAGPESFIWTKPVLPDQPDKLEMMKMYLTRAEAASRIGHYLDEYQSRYDLAQSFKDNPDDQWLVDHFFTTCLEVAMKVPVEVGGKIQSEGHCNVGLCLQKRGNFREAAKHFEAYHKLAANYKNEWKMSNGTSFYTDSCIKLYHIYTIIGAELARSAEQEERDLSLETLKQALEMAKNSLDKKLEGEASYNLGMAFQKINDLDTALSHLFNFYESCQGDSNSEGIGRACDSIAKIYARQGNKEKSVEFLKRFVELTEKTGLEKEYCLACHNLGNVCNSVGNYDEATEYFSKAYNISRALGDPISTNVNRVQYGIAMAHRMMGKFANHIVVGGKTCITRLAEWKSVRTDEFSKPIPDTVPGAAHHVVLPPPPAQKETEHEEEAEEEAHEMKETQDPSIEIIKPDSLEQNSE